MDRPGIITRSTEMLGPMVDASGGPSELKEASLDCHNSVILEQPTSLKNACHRAMIIAKDNDKKGDGCGMHEPCKNKGLTTMKQKALSIKEMTKKDIMCTNE